MQDSNHRTGTILFGLVIFSLSKLVNAGVPVWTFTPLTPTSISVPGNGTATVQYTITNQSTKSHTLTMSPIQGITQITTGAGVCGNPFTLSSKGSSCTLSLQVNGSQIANSVSGGPEVCDQGSSFQCYRPSSADILNIVVTGEVTIFPVSEGPGNVTAVPGNSQATVSWAAPTNKGTGTITGYTVTFGPTSGTTFTTPGCTTSGLSCTVNGLTNGTAYTFAVTTTTMVNSANETGPAVFSSSVIPTSGLAVIPSTLALSGLGSGTARMITLTNNSGSSITISHTPISSDFSPALPAGSTLSLTTCMANTTVAPGQSCTITITPGSTVSSNNASALCTTGVQPQASVLSISTSAGSVNANVVVLGYACQYQGGYIFLINDTTPLTGSIGGKVVSTADQVSATTGIVWSPGSVLDSIWGIDDSSTTAVPSPNASSSQAATLTLGQLNCDAVNDGACTDNNIFVFYGAGIDYAAGICRQPLNNSGAVCTGGQNCYIDWYLPTVCEMGPFGSTGSTGNYPILSGSKTCTAGSTNIQNTLVTTSIVSISGIYWSSAEASNNPQLIAWNQFFDSSGGIQFSGNKTAQFGVRCSRSLTI